MYVIETLFFFRSPSDDLITPNDFEILRLMLCSFILHYRSYLSNIIRQILAIIWSNSLIGTKT